MVESISLSHLNLPVADIERSLDFYEGKLGFRYVRHLRPGKVILDAGGFDFFREEAERYAAHPRFHFGFLTTTEGVYEFARLIETQGIPQVVGPQPTGLAEIYVTPDELRTVFYFADPDQHVMTMRRRPLWPPPTDHVVTRRAVPPVPVHADKGRS